MDKEEHKLYELGEKIDAILSKLEVFGEPDGHNDSGEEKFKMNIENLDVVREDIFDLIVEEQIKKVNETLDWAVEKIKSVIKEIA